MINRLPPFSSQHHTSQRLANIYHLVIALAKFAILTTLVFIHQEDGTEESLADLARVTPVPETELTCQLYRMTMLLKAMRIACKESLGKTKNGSQVSFVGQQKLTSNRNQPGPGSLFLVGLRSANRQTPPHPIQRPGPRQALT